ncbi:hypothetical protein M9H77_26827 [Catharanthus roseus]|uniref:Uncharacterized protein n=1 Tax=Catharanthus roseus TaxID=4058 RepID=A0ACC0ACX9_CATRO|nr:hypothetical protein M9H77_26827 [Catharanthus roseus]
MEYNWSNPSWKWMEAKSKQEDYQSKLARDMHNFHHGGGNECNAYGGNYHGNGNFTPKKDIMELVTFLLMLNLLNMITMSIVLMIVMKSIIIVMVSGGFKVLNHLLWLISCYLSLWFDTLMLPYYIDLVHLQVLGLKLGIKIPIKFLAPLLGRGKMTPIQTRTIHTGEIILISPGSNKEGKNKQPGMTAPPGFQSQRYVPPHPPQSGNSIFEEKVLFALKGLESMTQILDSHTQSITKLETQIGQLANAISRRDEENLICTENVNSNLACIAPPENSSLIVNHELNMRAIDPG